MSMALEACFDDASSSLWSTGVLYDLRRWIVA